MVTATQLAETSSRLEGHRERLADDAELRMRRARAALRIAVERGGVAPEKLAQMRASIEHWRRRLQPKAHNDKVRACAAARMYRRTCRCGAADDAPLHCGVKKLCAACGGRYYRKLRRRLTAAFSARANEANAEWKRRGRPRGQDHRPAMITLTLRDSGDVGRDRKLLSDAWHRFAAWYRRRMGENLVYAWVAEFTPGRRSRGHVHAHVCALLPFVKFALLHDEWRRATACDVCRSTHRAEECEHSARVLQVDQVSPGRAASYVAKYASKGCMALDAPIAAEWYEASHGMRTFSTSRHFFLPEECWHRRTIPGVIVKAKTLGIVVGESGNTLVVLSTSDGHVSFTPREVEPWPRVVLTE